MVFRPGHSLQHEVFEHPIEQTNIKIHYFGEYRPYWIQTSSGKKRNTDFDSFSGRILDFKDGKSSAIDHFMGLLDPILSDGVPIVIVPGHKPNRRNPGFRRLVKALCYDNRVDASSVLVRHIEIPKLAHGGDRSYSKHLSTMKVQNVDLVAGKKILLLDDVATSGNSIMAGRTLLLDHGVAKVICLVLGRTKKLS